MRRFALRAMAIAVVTMVGFAVPFAVAEKTTSPKIPGLGDPGKLASVVVDEPEGFVLHGPESRHQLIITGKYATGQLRDLTHKVTYEATPAGIIQIDSAGFVTPLAEGTATVLAKSPEGLVGKATLSVDGFTKEAPIDFVNQIVPIFTKFGCNSGGCHGKATGQNGFKLSLLGFYPDDDFSYLVKEARGRRLFPGAPDRSLVLLKTSNALPHGGGRLLGTDSYEYRILRRWIAQGMPYGNAADRKIQRIEVFPKTRKLNRSGKQQVRVIAFYSDGSSDDVTQMAQYDPNDTEMAGVTSSGNVTAMDLTGEVAIMARYQANVSVFRASIPLGIEVKNLPKPTGFVDELVFEKLKVLGVPPSLACSDSVFLRRATIDIAGRIPSVEEAEKFLADKDPGKRDKLIDRLLDSPGYADYFANKWSSVLRNKRLNANYTRGTYAFHEWIRDSLLRNKPYDEFVRDILAASGEIDQNPPVTWYRAVSTINLQVEDTAQLFLGLRIQCARCHHHPFERWSNRDYYTFSAFFSRVGRKNGRNSIQVRDDVRIFHNRGQAVVTFPRTGERVTPQALGSEPIEIDSDDDPRHALVDWMADPKNPFFARALVNRYWKHFFSRGIVDPEDDMRVTNPPTNEKLLEALAQHFIKSGYDLKGLVRAICRSKTYQFSSEPNEYNITDKQNYASYYAKRLNAEVLYDSLNLVTNVPTNFGGVPVGTRAVQLPDSGVNNYFLDVFGRPKGESACECERVSEANLAQSLHLLNSNEIQGKLTSGNGRVALLVRDKERTDEQKVRELYLSVYSRPPVAEELAIALPYINRIENKQQAYEDILWALINTKEFLFNH